MILAINSGSSSIKYKLFGNHFHRAGVNTPARWKCTAGGMIDRIGIRGSGAPDHVAAIRIILDRLAREIGGISKIEAVGHRVVHGGGEFNEAVLLDGKAIKAIKRYSRLAPLHNPPNLLGIEACKIFMPRVPQAAVFDTAFYRTLPEAHYVYALPYKLYGKDGVRRYGFHGTSHKYVAIKTAEFMKRPLSKLKVITCHLGNGCSITAIENGRAVDTSMGFTPLEGLVMGTRSGDIDPAIILYLMEKRGMRREEVDRLLNKESGLLGVSGISSDMRDIYKAAEKNKRARLAFDIFIHRIQRYIGAFAAVMDGADAIAFSGGIGENHSPTRRAVCGKLGYLGVRLDSGKNKKSATAISGKGSRVRVLVIPTDEELMIAMETEAVLSSVIAGRPGTVSGTKTGSSSQ